MFLLWDLHMRNPVIKLFKVILSIGMFVMFWRAYFVLFSCHFPLVFRVSSSESRFPNDGWFSCVLSCVLIQGPVLQNNLGITVSSSLSVQYNSLVNLSRTGFFLSQDYFITSSLLLLGKDLFKSLILPLILVCHVHMEIRSCILGFPIQ